MIIRVLGWVIGGDIRMGLHDGSGVDGPSRVKVVVDGLGVEKLVSPLGWLMIYVITWVLFYLIGVLILNFIVVVRIIIIYRRWKVAF